MGDLRLSGSIIRKSRFIFTKERRAIRQKSGCFNHSNERVFQDAGADQGFLDLYIQMSEFSRMQGQIRDSWTYICIKVCGSFYRFYLIYLRYPKTSHENEIIWSH